MLGEGREGGHCFCLLFSSSRSFSPCFFSFSLVLNLSIYIYIQTYIYADNIHIYCSFSRFRLSLVHCLVFICSLYIFAFVLSLFYLSYCLSPDFSPPPELYRNWSSVTVHPHRSPKLYRPPTTDPARSKIDANTPLLSAAALEITAPSPTRLASFQPTVERGALSPRNLRPPATPQTPVSDAGAAQNEDGDAAGPQSTPLQTFASLSRDMSSYVAVVERDMSQDEYIMADEVQRLRLQIKGQYLFCSYAPRLFKVLRGLFNVSEEEFSYSVRGDPRIMKKNFSEGASGSFFYFTVDQLYMVKTLSEREFQFLLQLLPSYTRYMRENGNSLICRFYGLYSIQMYGHTGKTVSSSSCHV